MRARHLVHAAGMIALVGSVPAAAETPRAELGKRLRRFETAWQEADEQRRASAVVPMNAAVRSFFSLQLSAAAARLDDAWLAVQGDGASDGAARRAIATAVTVSPLLADVSCEGLSIGFEPLYDVAVDGEDDEDATLRLSVVDAAGRAVAAREGPWKEAAGTLAWTTGPLPPGDHRLVVERRAGGEGVAVASVGISRVDGLEARRSALDSARHAIQADALPSVRPTVAAIADLLGNLAASRGQETDYPAARLLAFAERLLADTPRADEEIAAEARRADCWLTLSDGRAEVPVRIRAPADAAGPLPVLFLLHGAGGSENMFFDTCGAGRAVTLGLSRGWLVVAPRQGLFGLPLDLAGMLDVLDDAFAIDRTRVFVAGHSMGAVQTTKQTALHPELVAAAAAIGGGGSVPAGDEARRVPWFVAAGAADFGRPGALALAKGLRAAGNRVEERIVPDVEHMVVVQAALDDLFAFFDEIVAGPGGEDQSAVSR